MLEPVQRLVGVQAEAEEILEPRRHLVEHVDVGPGREELLPLAPQDDDVYVVIHARVQDRVVELTIHLVGVRVRRRVVQLDDRQAVLDPILHQLGLRGRSSGGHVSTSVCGRSTIAGPGAPPGDRDMQVLRI